ncbi:MAG: ATP-binding protein [Pseudomonadota bacterium]
MIAMVYAANQVSWAHLRTADGAGWLALWLVGAALTGLAAHRGLTLVRDTKGEHLCAEPPAWPPIVDAATQQGQKIQAIGQLAGGIAHDFNNLLTAIIGYCDLLIVRFGRDHEAFVDLMHISQNAKRGMDLVRQLLTFARQGAQELESLDLSVVVGDLAALTRRLVGGAIAIHVKPSKHEARIQADPTQIRQVILNLIINARDAIEAVPQREGRGLITLRIDHQTVRNRQTLPTGQLTPGRYVTLAVSDNGVGIENKDIGRIFDPFFTTKPVGKGTGLGLATTFGIIRQSGGHLALTTKLGKGTTFTLYLPDAPHPASKPTATEDSGHAVTDIAPRHAVAVSAANLASARLLLVEDEPDVRTVAARALRRQGFTVIESSQGRDALEKLAEARPHEPFDLVITDLIMPEMDGHALIERVRRDYPDLPILCTSGYSEDDLTDRDAVRLLRKPYTLVQLVQAVGACLSTTMTES